MKKVITYGSFDLFHEGHHKLLKRAKELIRLYGAERVVFGTDFPMWSVSGELNKFYDIKLTEEENRLILCDNAMRILNKEV